MRAGLISYEQQWDQVVSIILMIKPVCAVHCQKEISTRSCGVRKKLGGGANQCTVHHTGPTFDFPQSSNAQANIIWAIETQMSSVCVCVWWGGEVNSGLARGALFLVLFPSVSFPFFLPIFPPIPLVLPFYLFLSPSLCLQCATQDLSTCL